MKNIAKNIVGKASHWWRAAPVAFSERFDRNNNAIGFMRTAFALLVILAHAFPLGGLGLDPLLRFGEGQETLGGVAVKGFFILSGFLITASYVYASSVGRYLWNRFLRIMPAFWVALVVVAFGFAPLMFFLQHGTLDGFLLRGENSPLHYIWSNALLDIKQYEVMNLTADLPWKHAFNGSLWTLVYEVTGYLLIAAFGIFGVFKNKSKVVLAATGVLYVLFILNQAVPGAVSRIMPFLADPQMLPLLLFFFAGSTWYLYRDKVQLNNKYAVLAAILYILGLRFGFHALVSPFVFTYLVFYLAAEFPIRNFDKKADFSYGIYIYAFPVQQLLAQVGVHQQGVVLYTLAAAVLTMPLAIASYYLVERPALKLKRAQLRIIRRRKKQ